MIRPVLLVAALTGAFCVGFAFFVDFVVDLLGPLPLAVVTFTSGFLGSLFGQTIVRPWRAAHK